MGNQLKLSDETTLRDYRLEITACNEVWYMLYVFRFLKYQRFGGEKNRSLLVFIFSKTQLTQIGLRFLEREKKRQKGKWGWNKSDSRNSTDCRLSSSCWERQLPMSSCSSCGPTVVDSCCQWGRLRPRPRGCYSRWGRPPAGPRYLCREVVDLQMLEHFYINLSLNPS